MQIYQLSYSFMMIMLNSLKSKSVEEQSTKSNESDDNEIQEIFNDNSSVRIKT